MFKYYFSNTWTGLGCSRALLYSSGVEIELSPYILQYKFIKYRNQRRFRKHSPTDGQYIQKLLKQPCKAETSQSIQKSGGTKTVS